MSSTPPSPPRTIEMLLRDAMAKYDAAAKLADSAKAPGAMTMEAQIHQVALAKARIFVRTKYGPRWFTERYAILQCTCAHDCVHKAMVDECALLEAKLDKWTQ